VKTDRMKNVITRSVGFEPDVNIEIYEMEVRKGDRFLLCSDGLSGLIDDDRMLEVLAGSKDLNQIVVELIDAANSNGGDDNISTIVVEVL
jgi:serine/threonine protein phosphatase PrpC